MATENSETRFSHRAKKLFEDLLARTKRQDEEYFRPFSFFVTSFFVALSIRASWELHRAGRPVMESIIWAAFISAFITIAPVIRTAFKLRRAKN